MDNLKDLNVVAAIKNRYGSVIDLDRSPMAIIEIIHNFRYLLDEAAGPDGTAGAPGTGRAADVGTAAVLNLLLELKRETRDIRAMVS